jgi:hypothetical protein
LPFWVFRTTVHTKVSHCRVHAVYSSSSSSKAA